MTRQRTYQLWLTAKSLGQRPSALVGLVAPADAWLAYQFDQAVALLGRYLDNKTQERDDKGNLKHKLESLLADQGARTQQRYRSIGKQRDL